PTNCNIFSLYYSSKQEVELKTKESIFLAELNLPFSPHLQPSKSAKIPYSLPLVAKHSYLPISSFNFHFLKMNKINIFCTSQAATAICLSMDGPSSSTTIQLGSASPPGGGGGGREIDRYNPIITDSRRINQSMLPSSLLPPLTPRPQNISHIKNRKSTSNPKNETKKKKTIPKTNDQKRKSVSSTTELNNSNKSTNSFVSRKSWSCTKPGAFITPPGSTRYLLSDEASLEKLLDIGLPLKLNPVNEADKVVAPKAEDSNIASKKQPDQVVVLRVSLHCKGCEKKVRKHISRMQGVSSFNIDFAANKVTVVGEVTPSEVLASISKVKNNAKLWTQLQPPVLSSSNPAPTLNSTLIAST
ncbi:hypothetical protein Leryth_003464, partial [Lithospermum erythrorhizon]